MRRRQAPISGDGTYAGPDVGMRGAPDRWPGVFPAVPRFRQHLHFMDLDQPPVGVRVIIACSLPDHPQPVGKTRTPVVGFFTEFDIRHVIPLESLARLFGCVGAKGRFLVVGLTQALT